MNSILQRVSDDHANVCLVATANPRRLAAIAIAILSISMVATTGCSKPEAAFSANTVYIGMQAEVAEEIAPELQDDIAHALGALFGSPDAPALPPGVEGLDEVLDISKLQASAGAVGSDEFGVAQGLYRQHCVHCHGITGDGKGPTAAFLNPYPRDFRRGTFKFTSTPIGVPPTTDDLRRILVNGIPGTAMPSFKLLNEGELDALVDYVKYLAIRGQVERRLIQECQDFFDPEEAARADLRKQFFGREYLVEEILASVVQDWQMAAESVTEVPQRDSKYDPASEDYDAAALAESVERGRELYYTGTANCFSCHGPSQLGDGQVTDYDAWTKEFHDWTTTPKGSEAYQEKYNQFTGLGGLPPRNIIPRNLRSGVYRGGLRPVDIFLRIHNGIDGTPMPESNKASLTTDDLWDLVNYVMSLPYEPMSQPGVMLPTNQRERS